MVQNNNQGGKNSLFPWNPINWWNYDGPAGFLLEQH